jgi:hypothetical protein
MPLGDLAGGLIGGALRLIVQFFLEIILEIVVRGPGYLICRLFDKDIDPEGGWVAITGIVFWIGLVSGGIFLWHKLG